jgi:hypothetical protein
MKAKSSLADCKEKLKRLEVGRDDLSVQIELIGNSILKSRSKIVQAIGINDRAGEQIAKDDVTIFEKQRAELIMQRSTIMDEASAVKTQIEAAKEAERMDAVAIIQSEIDRLVPIYNEQAAKLAETLRDIDNSIDRARSLGGQFPMWRLYGTPKLPTIPKLFVRSEDVPRYDNASRNHFQSTTAKGGNRLFCGESPRYSLLQTTKR